MKCEPRRASEIGSRSGPTVLTPTVYNAVLSTLLRLLTQIGITPIPGCDFLDRIGRVTLTADSSSTVSCVKFQAVV